MSKVTYTTTERMFGFMQDKTRKMIANGAGIAGWIGSNVLVEAAMGSLIPGWFKPYTGIAGAYAGLCIRSITKDYLDQTAQSVKAKAKAAEE